MTLIEFLSKSEFSKQTELRKSVLICFFNLIVNHETTFTVSGLAENFSSLGYSRPNTSRLSTTLKKSKMFVSVAGTAFKVHPLTIETLNAEYPNIGKKSEDVVHLDSVIPESLLQKERAFILQLIRQINSSYENHIYDGCAVLMRRLFEILLILGYQELKIESVIQDATGNFKQLNVIIDDAKVNKIFFLSRNTRESLETFRKLGNFSAHKIYYNATRKSIENEILNYRAMVEELLYKSNLRT